MFLISVENDPYQDVIKNPLRLSEIVSTYSEMTQTRDYEAK